MTLVKIGNRYLNLDQVLVVEDKPAEEHSNDFGRPYQIPAKLRVVFVDTAETFEGAEADALRELLDNWSTRPLL